MDMKKDIKEQAAQLLAPGDYVIVSSEVIPGPGDNRVTFGSTGVQFNAVALFIDMRGSTRVINEHRPQSAAKIHKAYLFVATKLIAHWGGQIRSYNGDSILAFFPGAAKGDVAKAIIAAGQIKWMLTSECAADFARYRAVDFGIGIDVGSIVCVKVGSGRNENHNDLIWIGNAVNRATVLSDAAKGPEQVWVSDAVRALMEDRVRYHPVSRQELWSAAAVDYNGQVERAWKTSTGWTVA